MKKRNVMVQTAVASALLVLAGASSAGTVTATNNKYASEVFKTAAGTPLTGPGAVAYNYVSPNGNINANGTVYFQIRLTNAAFAAAPAFGAFTVAGLATAAAAGAGKPGVAVTLSTDKSTIEVAVTAPTDGSLALGVNALVWTPAAGNVVATTALGTPGTSVMAQMNFSSISGGNADALDAANPLPASGDGVTASAAIATSGQAFSGSVSALGVNSPVAATPAYGNQISLTAVPVASDYTSTGQIALGAVTYKNSTTTYKNAKNTATPYGVDADSTSVGAAVDSISATITVTPTGAFPIGATFAGDVTSNACAALVGTITVSPAGAVTAANASAARTLTVPAGNLTNNTPVYVCLSKPSTGNTAAPFTTAITTTTVQANANESAETASGSGYAVTYNGSSAVVRNYIPSAVTGYIQTVRVINTGSVAAPVSVQLISDGGTAGSSVVVIPSLAVGASARLSQAQIEAAVGAVAADSRPRLLLTAPTNAMEVQSFFNNANGAYTNLSGKE